MHLIATHFYLDQPECMRRTPCVFINEYPLVLVRLVDDEKGGNEELSALLRHVLYTRW